MDKSIAQNIELMPPPFSDGLDVWSRQNGVPGSATYENASNAQVLFTDPDFDECLEIVTNTTPQKLRFMGATPSTPGCYLKISARVKVVSGVLPSFEIAGFPIDEFGNPVTGLVEKGPQVAATEYDRIYEVSAIYGSGDRPGVDCVWGLVPIHGHFGLNVVGAASGSSVRIESVKIEDVTSAFLRVMMDWVDVRDYGAKGDGVFDNKAAFEAADAAAAGREVLVPEGDFFVDDAITLNSRFRFVGRVLQAENEPFNMLDRLSYSLYLDAFKDETLALKKALRTLFNDNDHDSLDLDGREINLSAPLDVAAAVSNRTTFTNRRVLRNGKIIADSAGAWPLTTLTSTASYAAGEKRLTNVAEIASVVPGMLVSGAGVGREIYVRAVDQTTGEVTLSEQLFGAAANQTYTFTRFSYVLDFSGFDRISLFEMEGVSIDGAAVASCLIMPPEGFNWRIHNCWFEQPRDRGLTSIGEACFSLHLDECEFVSSEGALPASARTSIGFNVNAADVKVRGCRGSRFKHFGVIGGGNAIVANNHFFQGLDGDNSRTAGLIFALSVPNATVRGNYVDNCWIEWTNEYTPANSALSRLVVDANQFFATDVASDFRFMVLMPHLNDMGLEKLVVTSNSFAATGTGNIDRFDHIDETRGAMDPDAYDQIRITDNVYKNVDNATANPVTISLTKGTPVATWSFVGANVLPFKGYAASADAVVATNQIKDALGQPLFIAPYLAFKKGATKQTVHAKWGQPTTGRARVTMRCDN